MAEDWADWRTPEDAMKWDIEQAAMQELRAKNERLQAENDRLREALRYGIGSAINELTARGLPKEWSLESGIGKMLEALGCKSTFFDEEVRCSLGSPAHELY